MTEKQGLRLRFLTAQMLARLTPREIALLRKIHGDATIDEALNPSVDDTPLTVQMAVEPRFPGDATIDGEYPATDEARDDLEDEE
jgi:hypothetical protein